MNERIKKFADQSRRYYPPTELSGEYWIFNEEKFAELIVQECAKVTEQSIIRGIDMAITERVGLETTQQALPSYVERKIKEHFEIEETPTPTVTAEMVKRLREETDRPLMECKKALYACNGDHEQAKQWLLDQRYYGNKI